VSSCRTIKNRLGRYHDGELPPAERALVERHLQNCRTCSEELVEIRRVSEAFQQVLAAPPVPEGLVQNLMARARMPAGGALSEWNQGWFWRGWSLSMRFAAAAVAAAACYIGLMIGSASLPSSRSAGDEMRWIGMTSRGPIVTAYVGANR
jgi:anti-sigma factor RsiW